MENVDNVINFPSSSSNIVKQILELAEKIDASQVGVATICYVSGDNVSTSIYHNEESTTGDVARILMALEVTKQSILDSVRLEKE